MKTLRFVPLTFLAGVHGFPMFISYVVLVAAVVGISRLFR